MKFLTILTITFLFIETISSESDLQQQNEENFVDPVKEGEDHHDVKDQSKRTIFSNHHGWAKHVGVHPAGFKYVLGYSPVELKYVPVVKPYKIYAHHHHPVKFHVKPHVHVRPIVPIRPVVHHDGWKPVHKPAIWTKPLHHVHHDHQVTVLKPVVKPFIPSKPLIPQPVVNPVVHPGINFQPEISGHHHHVVQPIAHEPAHVHFPHQHLHLLQPQVPAHLHLQQLPHDHVHLQQIPQGHVHLQHIPQEHVHLQHLPQEHVHLQHIPQEHVHLQHIPQEHLHIQPVPQDHVHIQHIPQDHVHLHHIPQDHVHVEHVPQPDLYHQHVHQPQLVHQPELYHPHEHVHVHEPVNESPSYLYNENVQGHVRHLFNQHIHHGDGATSNILLHGSIQPGHTDLQVPVHLPHHPNYLPDGRAFEHDPHVIRPSISLEAPYIHKK